MRPTNSHAELVLVEMQTNARTLWGALGTRMTMGALVSLAIQSRAKTAARSLALHVLGMPALTVVEEKFGTKFRVLSEMRGKFLYIDLTKYKIWIEMG